MKNEQLISVEQVCTQYRVEMSFIDSLSTFGLIEIVTSETTPCIGAEQLKRLEQFMHLHYDLDINLEGIDVISNMLQRMDQMQDEIKTLRNRLRFYED